MSDSPAEPSPDAAAAANPAPPRRRRWPLFAILAAVVAGGVWYYLHGLGHESTDDAFVMADVYQINARVAGPLVEVKVRDNQLVRRGDVLAVIESADYQSRVHEAEAAVALAKAQLHEAELDVTLLEATTAQGVVSQSAAVTAAEAQLAQQKARLAAANVEALRTAGEAERYGQLTERAVSRQRLQDLDSARTAADATLQAAQQGVASADANIGAAKAALAGAEAERARVDVAKATVARREAELQSAEAAMTAKRLDLSYTQITAPADGRVTRKLVLPGTFVQPGQTLMALVGTEVWVVANFKETQLRAMHAGQPVAIEVDAFDIAISGRIDSIQHGSGAAFSLLPPENATGNYVKVVQRVPVKILLDAQPDPERYPLGPGMSVVPTVDVR